MVPNGSPSGLGGEARAAAAALMFLTRLPSPRWAGHGPEYLARSTAYFPLVGVVVGLVGAAAYWAGAVAWTPLVAAALSSAATAWTTGAFHEDALADACDGFGGGWTRDQVLAIMKDSRIGSYGAVGLVLALALKVGALAAIAEPATAARALVAGHVLGRWSSLPLIRALPYVREGGPAEGGPAEGGVEAKGRPFAGRVTGARLAAGTGAALAVVAIALLPLGTAALAAALAAALLCTWGAGRYFRRRLGGVTGDCLGAANQAVELVTYLVLASAWLRA